MSAPQAPAPSPALYQPGDVIGRYEVLTLLGRGGFSQVFKVQDAEGRLFALKVMALSNFGGDDNRDAQRLAREAATLAHVRHPNIVRYEHFDIDPQSDRLFLVLEFVEGVTLRHLMHTKRLKIAEVVDIGLGIAAGLHALHQRSFIHRDVKPENVMVTPSGEVKLLDLGIIKAQGVSQGTTRPVGTHLYMSPEALDGKEITPAADVYALGHMLYELCTGEHAFTEPDKSYRGLAQAQVIVKHLRADFRVVPLHERCEHLPEAFAQCVDRAMMRDPRARQPHGGVLETELTDIRRRLAVRGAANNPALHARLSEIGLDPVETAMLLASGRASPPSTFVPTAMTQPIDHALITTTEPTRTRLAVPSGAPTLRSVAEPHALAPRPSTLDPTTTLAPAGESTSWLDLIDRQHFWFAALGLVIGGAARMIHVWLT